MNTQDMILDLIPSLFTDPLNIDIGNWIFVLKMFSKPLLCNEIYKQPGNFNQNFHKIDHFKWPF